jgi:hypothetical protein
MKDNTATTTATMDELHAEVAKLRARLDAHEEAQRLIMFGIDHKPLPTTPRLRVIPGSARRCTAPRGRLRLAK